MRIRTTHTYSTLELSPAAFSEIRTKLIVAGYQHAFLDGGRISMEGIAVETESVPVEEISMGEEERLP